MRVHRRRLRLAGQWYGDATTLTVAPGATVTFAYPAGRATTTSSSPGRSRRRARASRPRRGPRAGRASARSPIPARTRSLRPAPCDDGQRGRRGAAADGDPRRATATPAATARPGRPAPVRDAASGADHADGQARRQAERAPACAARSGSTGRLAARGDRDGALEVRRVGTPGQGDAREAAGGVLRCRSTRRPGAGCATATGSPCAWPSRSPPPGGKRLAGTAKVDCSRPR